MVGWVLLWLSLGGVAEAAIGYDTASSGTVSTTATSSHAHTFATETVGLVCVTSRDTTTAPTVATVTVGTRRATFVRRDTDTSLKLATELWWIDNPPSGSQTVTVTLTATPDRWLGVAVVSLTGVDFLTPIEAQNGASDSTGTSSAPSVAVTTVSTDAWVVDCVGSGSDVSLTAGAGQTSRVSRTLTGGGATDLQGVSTEGPVNPAGSTTMSWTSDAASSWVLSAVALRPNPPTGNCDRRVTETGTDVRVTEASDVRITEGTGGSCPAGDAVVPVRMLLGVGL